MNGSELKQLESGIASLKMSSDILFANRRVSCSVEGRNSEYISRQNITYMEIEYVQGIYMFNDKHSLWINPPEMEEEVGISRANIPSKWLEELFSSFNSYYGTQRENTEPITEVLFPNNFSGYNDQGEPLFERKSSFEIEGKRYELNTFPFTE